MTGLNIADQDLQLEYSKEVKLRLKYQLEADQLRSELEESGLQLKVIRANYETDLSLVKFEAEQSRQEAIFWRAKHEHLMTEIRQMELLAPKQLTPQAFSSKSGPSEDKQLTEEDLESNLDYSDLYLEEKSKVASLVKTVEDLLVQVEELDQHWKQRRIQDFTEEQTEEDPRCICCDKKALELSILNEANTKLTEDFKRLHSAIAKAQLLKDRGQASDYQSYDAFVNSVLDLAQKEQKLAAYKNHAQAQETKVASLKTLIENSKVELERIYKDNTLLNDRIEVLKQKTTPYLPNKLEASIQKTMIDHLQQHLTHEEAKGIAANTKLLELQSGLKYERTTRNDLTAHCNRLETQVNELKMRNETIESKLKEYESSSSLKQFGEKTNEFLAQLHTKHSTYVEKVQSQKLQLDQLQNLLADKEIELGEVKAKARDTEILLHSKLDNAKLAFHNESEAVLEEMQQRINLSKLKEAEQKQQILTSEQELALIKAECNRLKHDLRETEQRLAEANSSSQKLNTQLAKSQSDLGNSTTETTKLKESISNLSIKLEALQGELSVKDQQIKSMQLKEEALKRLAEVTARAKVVTS